MAYTRGRCTNLDYCSIAESRRDVEVRVGDEFVCPECGKPLKTPQIKAGGSFPVVPALIGVGVLALIAGAVFLGMRMGSGVEQRSVASVGVPAIASGAASKIGSATPPGGVAQAPTATTPLPPSAIAASALRNSPASGIPAAVENVLARVYASKKVGDGLIAPLASAYLTQIGDETVTTMSANNETRVTGLRSGIRESIVIAGDEPAQGFAALEAGKADAVVSPRRVLPSEQQALAGLGSGPGAGWEHVLAFDARAAVVNPGNPLPSLTMDQLKTIFSGVTTNWSSLGGIPGPIDVYVSQATLDPELALGVDPGAKRLDDSGAVSRAVVADPRGIGLVDLAAIGAARSVPIAEIGAAPIAPTNRAAIVADEYPLASRLYVYTSPKSASGFGLRFVEYALSAPGQAIVEQRSFVSPTMKLEAAAAPAPQTEADKFKIFAHGSKRLAVAFRFQANSTVLDQYGERDLDRVANYLVSLHDGGDHLLLAGFADNQGDPAANLAVAKRRADAVAALFVNRGLTPGGVAGFGAEYPLADNGTEAGRERNRRVEVYIKP